MVRKEGTTEREDEERACCLTNEGPTEREAKVGVWRVAGLIIDGMCRSSILRLLVPASPEQMLLWSGLQHTDA